MRAGGKLGRDVETAPASSPGLPVRRTAYALVYLASLALFGRELARFRDAQTGLSSLILFGDHFAPRRLPQLADVPLYTYAHSDGYDGQFYAQMAVAGNPFDPALARALDAPAYRERRILVPLAVHLLALGRPAAIVQLFALANVICLALLAALLARWWFPPGDLGNLLRWAGVVFSAGMVVSTTRSLIDGPALLLLAVAARQLERGRHRPAAVLLALAGLARETSLLAAGAFWTPGQTPAERRRALGATVVAAGPALGWALLLASHFQHLGGLRNLAGPFAALPDKGRALGAAWRAHGFDRALRGELLVLLALAVQIGFFVARRHHRDLWWRLGAAFALFAPFLGAPVWEGFPSAAARALLPLSLAFNRLAPRSRRGLALLVAGNLGLLAVPDLLGSITPSEQVAFVGGVRTHYQDGWLVPEHAGRDTWRWSSRSASLALDNPGPAPRSATLDFQLRSVTARTVAVAVGDAPPRRLALAADRPLAVHLGPLPLPAGRTEMVFSTDAPPWSEPGPTGRPLAFSLHRFFVSVAPEP